MYCSNSARAVRRAALITIAALLAATSANAHEAWLLTPAEIAALASAPMPGIFTSYLVLGVAAAIGCAATISALFIEEFLHPVEAGLEPVLHRAFFAVSPLILRLSLALMLALAGTGGLPRHGTAAWVQPTFFVPDMQLSLVTGWDWLAPLQIGLAALLVAGLATRIIALVLMGLVGVGYLIFGTGFLAYAPHFIAPALIIYLLGAGPVSLDRVLGNSNRLMSSEHAGRMIWRIAQVLVGGGFVYLAVAYKLTQPTLLIAILQHGDFPTFGLPYPVIALVMTGVEIICGALLIAGRLIRPVSLVIIGAITFLAITLGETPLFHANLYGAMVAFALGGAAWPRSNSKPTPAGRALA